MKNDLISPNVVRKSVLADKSFEKKIDSSTEVQIQKNDAENIEENKLTQNDAEVNVYAERQVETQEATIDNQVETQEATIDNQVEVQTAAN